MTKREKDEDENGNKSYKIFLLLVPTKKKQYKFAKEEERYFLWRVS
jgi:hypothetical protein